MQKYPTKDELDKKRPVDHKYFLSCDKDVDKGNKYFMAFDSPTTLIKFLEEKEPKESHFYEIIYDMYNHPVFVFFDLDRELKDDSPADLVIKESYDEYLVKLYDTFVTVFERFLNDIYPNLGGKSIGYQVSYTPKPNKVSLHFKIDIRCTNMAVLKEFAYKFNDYVTSNAYTSPIERDFFSFFSMNAKNQNVEKRLIDLGVYTSFRSLRTLYSSKLKSNNSINSYSRPFGRSSRKIIDHLVLCSMHPSDYLTQFPLLTPDSVKEHIPIIQDPSKKNILSHLPVRVAPIKSSDEIISRPTSYPASELDHVRRLIISHPDIHKLFNNDKLEIAEPIAIFPTIWTFRVINSASCTCPYANRCHHSNHLNFRYDGGFVYIYCFNEECQKTMKSQGRFHFPLSTDPLTFVKFAERNARHTMHCADSLIEWNEVYDSETMQSYPLKPLVCIKAGMGVGKTKLLTTEFIGQFASAPDTKCLFITYQILLSKKYLSALQQYGFINYLDCQGPIHDNKVIVCLDSLARVMTSNFDCVFIDEALSVLLHFNSQHMKNVSKICSDFDLITYQAKHIYLLDACVDNTLIYNFVKYLSVSKGVKPYWIKNTHIRPSNRKCTAYVNNSKSSERCLQTEAIEKVCSLIQAGKKVVVSSSTKTFTNSVELIIKERFGSTIKYIVYNSDSDKNEIAQHAENIHEVWSQLDLIIYSPTIGAGLSFELPHFDVLVSFFSNSTHTASVDFCLQQLFRVRQLNTGEMYLYINDVSLNGSRGISLETNPIEHSEIDKWLDKNVRTIQSYFPSSLPEVYLDRVSSSLKFETEKLSYKILTGIISTKNKSLCFFVDILLKTLQTDYNIDCKKHQYESTEDIIEQSIKLYEKIKKMKESNAIPFDPSTCIIRRTQYDHLTSLEQKQQKLSPLETLQKWIFHVVKDLWDIPSISMVDEDFFKNYIGQYNQANLKKAYERLYQASRTNDFLLYSIDHNKTVYNRKMNDIRRSSEEYNIELFKTKISCYYNRLIEGQCILNALNITPLSFTSSSEVLIESIVLEEKIKAYLSTITDDKFKAILNMFEMKKESYETRKHTMECAKKLNSLLKQVLKVCFNMEVGTKSRGILHPQLKTYNNPTRFISIASFNTLKTIYNPGRFTAKTPARLPLSFTDEECDE